MTPNDLARRLELCIRHARASFVTASTYNAWRAALEELAPKHVKTAHHWGDSSSQDACDIARSCGNADQLWAIFVMLFPDLVEKANLRR